MTGSKIVKVDIDGTASDAVAIPDGYTLVGINVPELTSTSFTISHSNSSTGAFSTLKDPNGLIETTAGSDVTFTIGDTSAGLFLIAPVISAVLSGHIKFTFGSSETTQLELIFRDLA